MVVAAIVGDDDVARFGVQRCCEIAQVSSGIGWEWLAME